MGKPLAALVISNLVLLCGLAGVARAGTAGEEVCCKERQDLVQACSDIARTSDDGLRMTNPGLSGGAEFRAEGIRFTIPGAIWHLVFQGYGHGHDIRQTGEVEPVVVGNRVEYRRGDLTEWYVNEPAGLEQGFTVANAPPEPQHGPLTVALKLSGVANATMEPGGKSMSMTVPGSASAVRYHGLAAWDALGRTLRTWLELDGDRLLVRVDSTSAQYPVVIDPYFQLAKLVASEGRANDSFGASLEYGNGIAVAGAPYHDIGTNQDIGAAYVYQRGANGWLSATESGRLVASNGSANDHLGYAVAASADGLTIVAGAEGASDARGVAYVYVKPSFGWVHMTEDARLRASDAGSNDAFGLSASVSADGSTIAIGSLNGDGAVYIFDRPSGGWSGDLTQSAKLVASDPQTSEAMGYGVALSADGLTLAAGAPFRDPLGEADDQGAVYVFTRSGSTWTQRAELTALAGASEDFLGQAVTINANGTTIAAGATGQGIATSKNMGAVYVFEMPSGGWVNATHSAFLAAFDAYAEDYFGRSLAITDNSSRIVVGSPGSNARRGLVYIFDKPTGGWSGALTETLQLTTSDSQLNDILGGSVDISPDGKTIVAAATDATVGGNVRQGAAYVFGDIDKLFGDMVITDLEFADGATGTDFFMKTGFSLDLSSNGIAPISEPVRIQIGSLFLTIPSGSFRSNRRGDYFFEGVIDGVKVVAHLKLKAIRSYELMLDGSNASFQSTTGAIPVTVSIGDDGGSATGTALNVSAILSTISSTAIQSMLLP